MKTNQYAAYVLLSIGLMVAYPLKGQETILSALDNTEVRVLMLPRHNAEPQLKTAQTNTIYVDSVKQHISGFGAADIIGWRPDMTDTEIEKAFGTDEGELGFSLLRFRIPPNENDWAINVSTAKKAYNMGVTLFGSPWSPPASMKTNNNTTGGELAEASYADYAAHLNKFATYMAENGAPMYAVSVQNEPDIEVSYESCDWTPAQMTKFVNEYGADIDVKLIAPESFQFRKPISDAILNDSVAASHLDIVGGHIYGGGLAPYPLAQEKGKELWMTEHLELDISYAAALGTGKDMNDVMQAGMSAYIYWYIVRFYGPIHDGEDWNGDDIVDTTAKGEITKRGYIMSHFSRFIRPDAHMVQFANAQATNLSGSAFVNADGKLVVVLINQGSDDINHTINLEGGNGNVTNFDQYVTSQTANVENVDAIVVEENQFALTIVAKSIVTLVSKEVAVANEVDESSTPERFKLNQNYPNPFNPSTTIRYQLPAAGLVSLRVFDSLGRQVSELVNSQQAAGNHQVRFNAAGLGSGIYFYRLEAGNLTSTGKMMLIKQP